MLRERAPLLFLAASLALGAPSAALGQIYTRVNANGVVEATNVPDSSGFRLAYVGKGTLIHSRGFTSRVYRGEFDRHIRDASSTYGVAVDLIKAVISAESEFDPLAVSSKGAQGLMQLMPFTARRLGVTDPFDPRQNVLGGTQYLRMMLDTFQGDVALALAGYNAGPNAVTRFRGIPPFKETQNYVQRIQRLFGGGFPSFTQAAASRQASYYAPAASRRQAVPARPVRVTPARPETYYKWHDVQGRVHVAQAPPDEGVTYSMIRALD
jgi:Transglycosylase SLT domain